jgi:outer membrane protein assembly factor BamB
MPFPLGPIVAAGRVLVAGHDPVPHIDAYKAQTGGFLWRSDPAGVQPSLNSSPVAAGNLVYQAVVGEIYAFDITTGSTVWKQTVRGGTDGAPAIAPGGRLFAAYPGHLYGLDSRSGDLLWHLDAGISGGGGTTPTVGDLVYMVDRDWAIPGFKPLTINAITTTTGALLWKRAYPLSYDSGMALDRDGLYFTVRPSSSSGTMQALDPFTGEELWAFAPDTSLYYAPVIAGRHVFVGSFSKTYAVDRASGEQVWSADVGGEITIAHRWVLVSTDDGMLHAYRAAPSPHHSTAER